MTIRGSIPIDITSRERGQLLNWASSEIENPKLTRNSKIILGINNGKTITQISEELNVSRQTISKIIRRFAIFRLEGIKSDAPKVGRKPTIWGDKAEEVLCMPLYAIHQNGSNWTGKDLARECNLPISTTYRFMNMKGVSLDDPRTFHEALKDKEIFIVEIAGFFLSPSFIAMVFSCETGGGSNISSRQNRAFLYKTEKIQGYFTNENNAFFKVVDEVNRESLLKENKRTYFTDFSIFLKLVIESNHNQRDILVVGNNLEMIMGAQIVQWLERHPRCHVIDSFGTDNLIKELRERLGSVRDGRRMKIGIQLEYLINCITEWRESSNKRLNVFASISPLREI